MRYLIGFITFFFLQISYANVIPENLIIDTNVTYSNTVIDLTKGNIIIKNGGVLKIENSQIIGKLASDHPFLIDVQNGELILNNNDVSISAPSIEPHDQSQSLQNVILLERAKLTLNNNKMVMHDPFRAGLLLSNANILTKNISIKGNYIEGFHGAIYLLNSDNLLIQDNILQQNSYGNIVVSGNVESIINNKIYLSGRDRLGNSIDLLGANNVLIDGNLLFMPTCHGIYSILSNDVVIQNNNIIGGITYAMTFLSRAELTGDLYVIKLINPDLLADLDNSNGILIRHNYMAQNRYGIQASDIQNLEITDNFFSQRFDNDAQRLFWTDNQNLLRNIIGLVWQNNLYKEAFTQDNAGSNAQVNIVSYPESGGVHL